MTAGTTPVPIPRDLLVLLAEHSQLAGNGAAARSVSRWGRQLFPPRCAAVSPGSWAGSALPAGSASPGAAAAAPTGQVRAVPSSGGLPRLGAARPRLAVQRKRRSLGPRQPPRCGAGASRLRSAPLGSPQPPGICLAGVHTPAPSRPCGMDLAAVGAACAPRARPGAGTRLSWAGQSPGVGARGCSPRASPIPMPAPRRGRLEGAEARRLAAPHGSRPRGFKCLFKGLLGKRLLKQKQKNRETLSTPSVTVGGPTRTLFVPVKQRSSFPRQGWGGPGSVPGTGALRRGGSLPARPHLTAETARQSGDAEHPSSAAARRLLL